MDLCIYNDVCGEVDKESCNPSCIRYLEITSLLEQSNIPKSRWSRHKLQPDNCDLHAFKQLKDIQLHIEDFVENDNFLYLYSTTCGNGKTTWSIKLLLQYFNEIWSGNGFKRRGLFINVPSFLSKCKDVISHPDADFENMRRDLPNTDLVVFDDMITTKLSNYDYSTLLTYTDQRIFNGKSTIFTGNIPPEHLGEYIGERLASRITSGIIIELKGEDRRNGSTANFK